MNKFFLPTQSLALVFLCSLPASATLYQIKAGSHYSTPKAIKLFHGRKMTFSAIFDQSAQYTIGDGSPNSDQADTNKLYRFTDFLVRAICK